MPPAFDFVVPPGGFYPSGRPEMLGSFVSQVMIRNLPADVIINECRSEARAAAISQTGAAVNEGIFILSLKLLEDYALEKEPVAFGSNENGSLYFIWEDDCGNHIFLEVGPARTIHLFYNMTVLGRWEGLFCADDQGIVEKFAAAMDELAYGRSEDLVFRMPSASNDARDFRWLNAAA